LFCWRAALCLATAKPGRLFSQGGPAKDGVIALNPDGNFSLKLTFHRLVDAGRRRQGDEEVATHLPGWLHVPERRDDAAGKVE